MSKDELQQMIFTNNLNHYINSVDVTQKEIADSIGVSPQTFNTWCQGIAIPRMGKIQALADYFNINKSDLIEDHKDFSFKSENYSAEELELIEMYRSLNDNGKQFVEQIKKLIKTSPEFYISDGSKEE